MNVASNIRKIRKEKGVNQEVIAEALDVDTSVISNIERGKRELKVSELEIIAKILDVDILYLFTYPKTYVDRDLIGINSDRISITFEVSSDKREHLLKMVSENK